MLHFSHANHGPWKIFAHVVQYLKRQNDEGATGGGMGIKVRGRGGGVGAGVAKEALRMLSRSCLNWATIPSISTLPSLTAQQEPAVTDCGSE
jgi:hypothetical protein